MKTLTTYRPVKPFSFFDEFDRFLGKSMEDRWTPGVAGEQVEWLPSVDVTEVDDHYKVVADIPGVDPKDIEVAVEDNCLRIKGERKSETKDEKNGYQRIERAYGTFMRQFTLPETVDADKISAKGKNGVLEIVIPKGEKPNKVKKITIN